jgi:hypothetical protein
LASGNGWAGLGQTASALDAYQQVFTIAVNSPYLKRAHARELLVSLEAAYARIGASELAQTSRQKIIELDQEGLPEAPGTPLSSPELPMGEEPISSAEVGALEEARRQAAFALQRVTTPDGQPPASMVNALAEALQAEDAAKLTLYEQELESTSQLSRRINVHWHVIRWLLLKYKIASGGFGVSIVPDWEAQLPDIQSALSKGYEDLRFDYEDLVTGLPDATLMGPGSYKVRRLVTLDGRLGQYPNYPEQHMADKIGEAVASLMAAGFLDELYVDAIAEKQGLHFFLSPASQYGVPAQEP